MVLQLKNTVLGQAKFQCIKITRTFCEEFTQNNYESFIAQITVRNFCYRQSRDEFYQKWVLFTWVLSVFKEICYLKYKHMISIYW